MEVSSKIRNDHNKKHERKLKKMEGTQQKTVES